MVNPEEQLLKFVQMIATHHPNDVEVNRRDGQPTIFEVTVAEKDEKEAEKYLGVFQAIIGCTTDLMCDQYEIRILAR